jgi:hypothetical protein
MKKLFNSIGSVLLTSLLFTGFVFTSCEQTTETQASLAFLARLSTLNTVNPPTVLESWTPLPDYAAQGGGGGHSVYGNEVFLSANYNDGSLGYSADGQTWQKISATDTTFGSSFIKYLAFLDDTFWAVGQGGKIATSTDGKNWTAHSTALSGDIYGVAFDGNETYMFVTDVAGSPASSQIAKYIGTWVLASTNPVPAYKIDSVTFSDGKFIIVCNGGWISYTQDQDYMNWAPAFQVKSPLGINTNHFKMIAVGEADDGTGTVRPAVVAVSRYGLAYAFPDGSLDPDSWGWADIYNASSSKTWLNCVLFDGSKFIVGGQGGAMAYSGKTLALNDWTVDRDFTWTDNVFGATYINGIAFDPDNRIYIATGGDGKPVAAYTEQ